ncbi:MAG: helix-turn-helix transcriptional regulator [Oligosphaeraceae bacterium]|nr:helix-turn-helix transcriptional regulator [Oligosphaeraceae bacterium]
MLFQEKIESLLEALVSQGVSFHFPGSRPAGALFGLDQAYYPAESHSEHVEMIHLTNGQVAIQVNGAWFPLTVGQPQVFLMNTFHSEHFLDSERTYELFWLSLNPFMINLHTTGYSPDRGYGQSSLRRSLHPPRMEALWKCLKKPVLDRPRFMALLLECLDNCLKNPHAGSVDYHIAAVELVRRYLEDYYSRQIHLADLADMCHYSIGHLSAIFRKTVGVPVYEYLCRIRLTHAARLLRSGKHRIKDVATATGFTDQLYFSRRFSKQYGMAPSRYAERFGRKTKN